MGFSTLRHCFSRMLPRAPGLPPLDFEVRHRLVRVVLAAHLPLVIAVGLLSEAGLGPTLAGAGIPFVLLLLAVVPVPALRHPRRHRVRPLATSLGLVACSGSLASLTDSWGAAYLHALVVVALVAIYEDAWIFVTAVGGVLLPGTTLVLLAGGGAAAHGGPPSMVLATHVGSVLALTAALLVFWRSNRLARLRETSFRRQLYVGERSVLSRQEQLARARWELLGAVTHEFRTPLTGMRGTLQLLRQHGDRLTAERQRALLDAALAHADRLARLIDNALASADPTAGAGPSADAAPARSPVAEVLASVLGEIRSAHAGRVPSMHARIDPHLVARMPAAALRQVLANLLDNAVVHGTPGGAVIVRGWSTDEDAVVTVTNTAAGLRSVPVPDLLEPFLRPDMTTTRDREGAGLGLYAARRLVEHHGGSMSAHVDDDQLTVRLELPLEPRACPAPAAPVGASARSQAG